MSNQLKANDMAISILFVLGVIAGWNFGLAYWGG